MTFGLIIGAYALWLMIGWGILIHIDAGYSRILKLIISPVIGVSVIVILLYAGYRIGYPVMFFAKELTVALAILSFASIVAGTKKEDKENGLLKDFLIVFFLLLLAIFINGWPLFVYGSDWLGFGNSDMTTLSEGAIYFLNNGFTNTPSLGRAFSGEDYSQLRWLLYTLSMHRLGAELLLAWSSGVTGWNVIEIFMSLTVASQGLLISSVAALTYFTTNRISAVYLSAICMSVTSLAVYSLVNNLMPQILGQSMLILSVLHLYNITYIRKSIGLGDAVIASISISAVMFVYPEMLAFVGSYFALVVYLVIKEGKLHGRNVIKLCAVSFVLIVVFVNYQIIPAAHHLAAAFIGGSREVGDVNDSLFFYYFKPSGFAQLWGLDTFSSYIENYHPWVQNATIIYGFSLSIIALVVICKTPKPQPAPLILMIMIGLAAVFYVKKSDFGLFKLSLYIQPFLVSAIVGYSISIKGGILGLVLVASFYVPGLLGYGGNMILAADKAFGATELWKGSANRLSSAYKNMLTKNTNIKKIYHDTHNIVIARIQALYSLGRRSDFSSDVFSSVMYKPDDRTLNLQSILDPVMVQSYDNFMVQNASRISESSMVGCFPQDKLECLPITFKDTGFQWADKVIVEPRNQSVFNGLEGGGMDDASYSILDPHQLKNHLIYKDSSVGHYYYSPGDSPINLWAIETDPMFKGGRIAAVGSKLLFLVAGLSESAQIQITYSASSFGVDNKLPEGNLLGRSVSKLPFEGRGSARVVLPINPLKIRSNDYIAFDFGDARKISYNAKGLQLLYGSEISADHRQLTGFIRDISVINSSDTLANKLDSFDKFPQNLQYSSNQYSGISEDGWIAKDSWIQLVHDKANELVLDLEIPLIKEKGNVFIIDIKIDDVWAYHGDCAVGECKKVIALPKSAVATSSHRIEIHSSREQILSGDDGRHVFAHIEKIQIR